CCSRCDLKSSYCKGFFICLPGSRLLQNDTKLSAPPDKVRGVFLFNNFTPYGSGLFNCQFTRFLKGFQAALQPLSEFISVRSIELCFSQCSLIGIDDGILGLGSCPEIFGLES